MPVAIQRVDITEYSGRRHRNAADGIAASIETAGHDLILVQREHTLLVHFGVDKGGRAVQKGKVAIEGRIERGRLALGTWQSIVVVDPNVDNPDRRLRVSFLPG